MVKRPITDRLRNIDSRVLWSVGGALLLLFVGRLIWQVESLSSDMGKLRERVAVLEARE